MTDRADWTWIGGRVCPSPARCGADNGSIPAGEIFWNLAIPSRGIAIACDHHALEMQNESGLTPDTWTFQTFQS